MNIKFATGNEHKLREVREIVGFDIEKIDVGDITEIQSMSVEEVAEAKARAAYEVCGEAVLVEDVGVGIDAWGGFPGPFIKYLSNVVGAEKILRMMEGEENRRAVAVCVVAYYDGSTFKMVRGEVEGLIATDAGESINGFGFDPIFVSLEHGIPFSELDFEVKNKISHRANAWNEMMKIVKSL